VIGQGKRVYFKNKTLAELSLYQDEYWNIPGIFDWECSWQNEGFSGYYTLDQKSTQENKILNGEIKLVFLNLDADESSQHFKWELTYNINNGIFYGQIKYASYSAPWDPNTNENNIDKIKWRSYETITANFIESGVYKNISYTRNETNKRYVITQSEGNTISMIFFAAVEEILNSSPSKKPLLKVIPK
jgi:hypothetical protein